jgi:hypothetical protein
MKRSSIKNITVMSGKRVETGSPLITKIDGTHFSILWRGPRPLEWAVQTQGAPDGEWDINMVVAGSLSVVLLTSAPYAARIVGRDADKNPVTGVSNVLILNPLPDKHIVLSYNPVEDELSWTFDGPAPAQWEIVNSTDGGVTYPNQEFIPGSATNEAPQYDNGQWKMRAANADNTPASAWSNVAVKS